MRLSEADGRPVVSRASAETVGELKHVIVDVGARRIVALHVAGRRRNARLVDWSSIVGFGPDGIVVEDDEAARPPADDREAAVASGKLDLDGRLVLTDAGDALGAVTDVEFDDGTGGLRSIVTGEEALDAGRLRAIGPYCVIVRATPEDAPGT
ncbi:MAG TPA: PRC-barrel domain-containing protein [Miltoncostaeaceae bacterium]|nr:PRC-barrel domain-containing protein [Miltoncostaeaceae bacterium]